MTQAAIALGRASELPAEPPEWVDLLPSGAVLARDGRRWTVADPEAVAAASRERAGATDPAIDYEHQSHRTAGEAPAAGWIKEIRAEGGAIRARVEWTAHAAARIRAREYRYLSPTFLFDAETGRVRAVTGAALTNTPALDLPALARARDGEPEMNEALKALLAVFGLDDNAAADAVESAAAEARPALAAYRKLKERADAEGTTVDELATAAARTIPDPAQYVPRAQLDTALARVVELESTTTDEALAAAVGGAIRDGKLPPSQRKWATAYARENLDGFRAFVAGAPVLIRPGRDGRGAPGDGGRPSTHGLTEAELAVCRAVGVSPEKYAGLPGRGEAA
ncbi:MAG: hypothetical protein OXH68_17010 [Gammaproteobacteria bacterium]|nr:hypothetical protein [Gammaproteobacteria bacterium]